MAREDFAIYDLLTIGDDASVGVDSGALGYTIENGMLMIGPVTIGRRCFVGTRSILRENTVMEDDAALEDLSLLPCGEKIPRGETWLGSPARPSGRAPQTSPAQPLAKWRHFAVGMLHAAGLLIFPLLVVSAILPGIIAMNELNYADDYYWYLFLSPFVGLSFVILLALEIVVVKWLLLGRVKPGRHPLHSVFYFRKWFVDQTFRLSLDILGPLYASLYLPPWYRMLGAKLGKGVELSTASFISPDLLSIAEEGFVADAVSLGATRVRDGFVTVAGNHIGRRSFIGNSAVLPPGAVIGESCLIGCLSIPPADAADAMRADTSWLGSPAIFLPQRQPSAGFGEEQTYKPPRRLRVLRAIIELIRVILPSSALCRADKPAFFRDGPDRGRHHALADAMPAAVALCRLRHNRGLVHRLGEMDFGRTLSFRRKTALVFVRLAQRTHQRAARTSGGRVAARHVDPHAVRLLVFPPARREDRAARLYGHHGLQRI